MKTAEEIKQDVINQLSWDSRVDASNVKIAVDGGTVTLTGNVANFSSKSVVEDVAWSVIGVLTVNNQLQVEFPTTYTVPSDTDITTSVEQLLALHAELDDSSIQVSVDAGVVTLEGSVSSFWEKTVAESEARNAAGVISVVNKLAVVPTEDISDEIVGERVVDRIDQNTTAIVDEVDVKVTDGSVSLSGTVPSWSTWRTVYDAALFTTGVTDVDDKLVIDYTG